MDSDPRCEQGSALCGVYSCLTRAFRFLIWRWKKTREQEAQTEEVTTLSKDEMNRLAQNLATLTADAAPYLNEVPPPQDKGCSNTSS